MTFRPTKEQIADALAYAGTIQPMEACGVIAGGRFIPVPNNATIHDCFVMDMPTFCRIDAATPVEAIVHSHVYIHPIASQGDRAMCEKTGLPWLIITWPSASWTVIEPCGWEAPLIGREWAWGSHDCWGLVRDGFRHHTGIALNDYPREWGWWTKGQNIIEEQFEKEGFHQLGPNAPWQHCDVVGMTIGARVVNHVALYLAPEGHILHQFVGKPSSRDIYGGTFQKATRLHLRHEAFL